MQRIPTKRPGRPLALLALVGSVAIVLLSPGPAAAATLQVCPSGCRYSTIADALVAAADGDRIAIAAGTYAGGLAIDKDVSLVGAGAGATAIGGGGPVVRVDAGASVTITG